MKKAIAYVSDIILGRTGEVIKRSCQVELIAQYAADNDIDIIGWFEDEMYNEDLLARQASACAVRCSIGEEGSRTDRAAFPPALRAPAQVKQ